MRVVLSAGGTAGHVSPALAIAQTLQADGAQVYFTGTPNSIEERLVKAAGIEFAGFSARGFNRRKPWTVPATLLSLSRGRSAAKRWLKQIKPQVVATFGGYASLPTGLAAASLRLRLLVHEQNA
ncbi:MAG: glycosyltransferase, partial [Coriobacteriales bacterium]|nr:glycosyltransferase [Coriobacteriales bacterium]